MKLLKRIVPIMIGLVCFGVVWDRTKAPKEPLDGITVTITATTSMSGVFQLFYDSTGQGFSGDRSVQANVLPSITEQEIAWQLPAVAPLKGLRIDPGDHRTSIAFHELRIDGPYRSLTWNAREIHALFPVTHDLDTVRIGPDGRSLLLTCVGTDPYMATSKDIAALVSQTSSKSRPVLPAFVLAALSGFASGWVFSFLLGVRIRRSQFKHRLNIRNFISATIVLLCAIVIFFTVKISVDDIRISDPHSSVVVVGTFPEDDDAQIFYSDRPNGFVRNSYVSRHVSGNRGPQIAQFTFPQNTDLHYLRFDPGMGQDTLWIDSLSLVVGKEHFTWSPAELKDRAVANDHIKTLDLEDGRLRIITNGNDPYFTFDEDLGPLFKSLRELNGNGPFPFVIALIASLFFIFGAGPVLSDRIERAMNHPSELLISIVFGLIISSPFLVTITGTEPELKNTEKRMLAQKPPFSVERALLFPKEFTAYYAENFGLRKLFFRWNSLFIATFLHTSPLPERALFGKDDWLFYMQAGAMQKYEGLCDIPVERIEQVADRLELRRQWLAKQGIHYVLMIPPEKSVIYGDKLPDRIEQFNEPSCLDILVERLKERTKLPVVDIRRVLKDARTMHDVYYTSDTHWNPIGAWYGYCALMNVIREHDPTIRPPTPFSGYDIIVDTNDQGDIAQMIGLNDVYTRITPLMVAKDSLHAEDVASGSYTNSGFLKYPPITKEVKGSGAPRLLVFRDSFSVYMISSLSEHFSRSTFVWTPVFIPDIVAEERPDIIVHEVMELYLSDLLQDDLPLPPLGRSN